MRGIARVLQGLGNSGARTGPGSLGRVLVSRRVSALMFEHLMSAAPTVMKQTQKQSQRRDPHCTRSMWMEHLSKSECSSRERPGDRSLLLGKVLEEGPCS